MCESPEALYTLWRLEDPTVACRPVWAEDPLQCMRSQVQGWASEPLWVSDSSWSSCGAALLAAEVDDGGRGVWPLRLVIGGTRVVV